MYNSTVYIHVTVTFVQRCKSTEKDVHECLPQQQTVYK